MKIKTQSLAGKELDWAVAKALNIEVEIFAGRYVVLKPEGQVYSCKVFAPSLNWAQGGPIIDREDITWSMQMLPEHGDATRYCAFSYRVGSSKAHKGPTKLIAAMRCYVATKLGEEVEVPENLLTSANLQRNVRN